MTTTPFYYDPKTNQKYPINKPLWRSPDGNPLMISDLSGLTAEDIISRDRSIWRYRKALPITIENPISLGEGMTPLVSHWLDDVKVNCKLEWFSPTGSFKDRGASVMMSYLRQYGVNSILEDSSGNGGSAIAAYGAAGSMGVKILAPESTQPMKITQMKAFGADVELVAGPRHNSQLEAIKQSEHTFYASHNWQAFFLQGTKLLAYEIWEDLGFEAPDNIIIPASAGSNILGVYIGFNELLRANQISKLPRIFCAQPENCAPVDAAFKAGAEDEVPCECSPTIAEGAAIQHPVRMVQVLEALRGSNGGTVTATESEIKQAIRDFAKAGLYVEPTSAIARVATKKLLDRAEIAASDKTVLILTGSGLKATQFMTEFFAD